ncbi:MAG: F0F1 ATP synthase subunit B [Steroidobacteraceae bacterium]
MNLNLTLILQMLVFAILVWFTMKFVWPIILGAMDERSKSIASGIAAGEKGRQELAQAESKAEEVIRAARERARQIEEQASRRSNETIEAAKQAATSEGARILSSARDEAATETTRARDALRREVGGLVVAGAAQLLQREVDAKSHADLIDRLAADIARGS